MLAGFNFDTGTSGQNRILRFMPACVVVGIIAVAAFSIACLSGGWSRLIPGFEHLANP